MQIIINTDNHISGHDERTSVFESKIKDSLDRFSERLTRIEVHINDENSHKSGNDDIRCMMEGRLEGRQPIAVTHNAATPEQALKGAIDKLKKTLDTDIEKKRPY
jgi:hypothetical protein